jgi:hypothetical protein
MSLLDKSSAAGNVQVAASQADRQHNAANLLWGNMGV